MSESIQYDDINITNLVDPAIDTMSRPMAQYLIDMIHNNKNILIVGSNESGRTLLLNVLAKHINMDRNIMCMEMKPELMLLEHNAYHIDLANVSPDKRIKDYYMISKGFPYHDEYQSFVLDDVPRKCFSNLYQLLLSGKQVLSVFNDESNFKLINSILYSIAQEQGEDKLKDIGVNLMEKIDVLVHIRKYSDSYIRVKEISETKGFHPANKTIMLEPIFGYHTEEQIGYEGKFIGQFVKY